MGAVSRSGWMWDTSQGNDVTSESDTRGRNFIDVRARRNTTPARQHERGASACNRSSKVSNPRTVPIQ